MCSTRLQVHICWSLDGQPRWPSPGTAPHCKRCQARHGSTSSHYWCSVAPEASPWYAKTHLLDMARYSSTAHMPSSSSSSTSSSSSDVLQQVIDRRKKGQTDAAFSDKLLREYTAMCPRPVAPQAVKRSHDLHLAATDQHHDLLWRQMMTVDFNLQALTTPTLVVVRPGLCVCVPVPLPQARCAFCLTHPHPLLVVRRLGQQTHSCGSMCGTTAPFIAPRHSMSLAA